MGPQFKKMSSSITSTPTRKRPRTSGDFLIYDESREKYIQTMADKRRAKITKMENLKKSRKQKNRIRSNKTNPDVQSFTIQQEWIDKIKAGKKNREFRIRTKGNISKLRNETMRLVRYLWYFVQGGDQLLIEFNGFDKEHEKWKTHYVLKLGRIISTDPDEIKDFIYKK